MTFGRLTLADIFVELPIIRYELLKFSIDFTTPGDVWILTLKNTGTPVMFEL